MSKLTERALKECTVRILHTSEPVTIASPITHYYTRHPEPGARLMWMGTFTKNWTTNLCITKMGINKATATATATATALNLCISFKFYSLREKLENKSCTMRQGREGRSQRDE